MCPTPSRRIHHLPIGRSDVSNLAGTAAKTSIETWNAKIHPLPSFPSIPSTERYQHKLKMEGKPSTMTDERVLALNALGFVWNAHEAGWEERFNELLQFKAEKGHCNVPSLYKVNQKLATWVKCARRQYKLLIAGKKSNMTLERATRLASVGFVWELRPTIMK